MRTLILIDSHALIHRAFHALPVLTSPKGIPTNAVYGFTTILMKMIGHFKPEYIAAAFDLAGPTFRHAEYEEYKAHREKAPDELYAQVPVVKDILATLGIPVYEHKGFEADDVIGSIAEEAKGTEGLRVVVITGDLDTLQLIDKDRVVVHTLRRGMSDTVTYNERGVIERFGLKPAQMIDYKGLKGDSSDNIPGVPGVGEKTTVTLLTKHKTLEKLYTALEKKTTPEGITEKLKAKLLEHKDQAFMSKKLGTIVRDVPVSFDLAASEWSKHLDPEALKKLCQDLGFYSLVKRLDRVLQEALPEPPQLELAGVPEDANMAVRAVRTMDELPQGNVAAVHPVVADGKLEAVCVATSDDIVFQLPTDRQRDLVAVLGRYRNVVGHDIKSILKTAQRPDLDTSGWFDTQIGAWLIVPDQREYALERVAYESLEHYLESDEGLWPVTIWRLYEHQRDKLDSLDLLTLMQDVEMPLIGVLARMEAKGITVDPKVLKELSKKATAQLASLQKKIWKLAGEEFNINSPQQLGTILFERLGIRGKVKRTTTGALSTAAGELEKIRDAHPIVDLILQWRELSKLSSTYIEPFPGLIAEDGRVHTTYNQTGTATGRLSSQDPNLQNIPTRTELGQQFRAAFVPKKGYELVSLDYSQIELRIVAHIADDATMKDAFNSGEDVHARTASVVFNVPMNRVTPAMRRQAKVLNFGIIYGMGVLGFSRAAGVPRDSARKFMDDYFTRFSGVARYMERTKKEVASEGTVSTLMGRRRPLPDIASGIPQLIAQAERMAVNHPIQGTNADIMKVAMAESDNALSESFGDDVRLLLQVHDELVFEMKKDRTKDAAAQAKKIMELAYTLTVPLIVDVKHGPNWSDMKPLET